MNCAPIRPQTSQFWGVWGASVKPHGNLQTFSKVLNPFWMGEVVGEGER